MKKLVAEIIKAAGCSPIDELAVGKQIEVSQDGFMDLTIEKVGHDRVSVAHYYTQRGDLMSDPEIVFQIEDDGTWLPIRYTQQPNIHDFDPDGIAHTQPFIDQWSSNLRAQGFIEAAKHADLSG